MKKTYKQINDILKKDFFWIPPYNSINDAWMDDFFKTYNQYPERAKYVVTKEVILPWRRAYQMVYRYKELSIFSKNVLDVIECSTIAFFQGNYPCAYLSLLPVIETLMTNWEKEITIPESNFKRKNRKEISEIADFISKNFKDKNKIQNSEDRYNEWLNMLIEDFEYLLTEVLYVNIKNYESKGFNSIFNRNSAFHYLENITLCDTEEARIGTIRLFLLIDLIAEIYFRSNYENYQKLWGNFDLEFNNNLLNLYWQFYINISIKGLSECSINTLSNVLFKENLTDDKIKNIINYLKIQNNIFEMLKKERDKKIKKIILRKAFKEYYKKANQKILEIIRKNDFDNKRAEIIKKINNYIWKQYYKEFYEKFKNLDSQI